MTDTDELNAGVIAEFRAHHGQVDGYFEGAPVRSGMISQAHEHELARSTAARHDRPEPGPG
jgi:hypothetical protein